MKKTRECFLMIQGAVSAFTSRSLPENQGASDGNRAVGVKLILTVLVIFFHNHSAFALNEFDQSLEFVRLWVPELPPPKVKLSPEKEKEFQSAWAQVGITGKKVESAWEDFLKNDPLAARALKALDRYMELEIQYNDLRETLRKTYGREKFDEMEAKWDYWSRNQENEWLDLEDTDLIRLTVWNFKFNNYQYLIENEPFSRFVNSDQKKTSVPVNSKNKSSLKSATRSIDNFDPVVTNNNQALVEYRPLSKNLQKDAAARLDANKKISLNEEEAVAVYKAGVEELRKQYRESAPPAIPDLMKQYLKSHAEAEYLFAAGDSYLRMTPRPKVEAATQELMTLMSTVSAIRPDLNEVLLEIHKDKFPQPAPEGFKWPSRRFMIFAGNAILISLIMLFLLFRSWQHKKQNRKTER